MRLGLKLGMAGTCAAALVAGAGVGAASIAAQAGPSPSDVEFPDGQTAEYVAVADRLDQFAHDHVFGLRDTSGLASVSMDTDEQELTVYWKGEPPEELRQLSTQPSQGLRLETKPAAYTRAETQEAMEKLFSELDGTEFRPAYIGSVPDKSRLRVAIKGEDVQAFEEQGGAESLESISGIPVVVEVVEGDVVLASRQDDADPWKGGGAMTSGSQGSFCSTGFTVLRTGNLGRLLSAGHCDPSGNLAWNDGTWTHSLTTGGGAVDVAYNDWDSMLVDPVGGTTGKVHGGPWYATPQNSSRYHLSVSGWTQSVINGPVCTSGANSGEHCAVNITDDQIGWLCGPYTCFGARADGVTQSPILAQGDSGGPVYANAPDGRVKAKGIISAIPAGEQTNCPSLAFDPSGIICGTAVYYVKIGHLLNTVWNVTLETSN